MEIYSLYVTALTSLNYNLITLQLHGSLTTLPQQIIFLAELPRVELQGIHIEVNHLEYTHYYRL